MSAATVGASRAGLVQRVDGGIALITHVGGLAGIEPLLQRPDGAEAELDLVSGCTGEVIGERGNHLVHRARAHDLELCHVTSLAP